MPGSIMKAAPTLTNTKRKEKASEVSSWASIPAPHAGRLRPPPKRRTVARAIPVLRSSAAGDDLVEQLMGDADQGRQHERKQQDEIGRESCWERVWQYVEISVVAVS